MKKTFNYKTVITVVTVALLALLLTSCGLIPGLDDIISSLPSEGTPKAGSTVKAEFYDRGEKVGESGDLAPGTILQPVEYDIKNDAKYEYEFLGWDADGDLVPETFPYTLTKDTVFTAMLNMTPVVYHYDIYVRGSLAVSKDCEYGDEIEYPEVQSSIEGEEVYLFLGWSHNGTFDTYLIKNVTENLRIEAVFADSQVLKLYYGGGLFAKYVEEGGAIPDLSEWGVTPDAGYSIVWYTDSAMTKEAPKAMVKGNLTLYGRQEPTGGDEGYRIENSEQLKTVMNSVILSRTTKVNMLVTYNYGKLGDLLEFISKNCVDVYAFKMSAETKDGQNLTLSISYPPLATVKSKNVLYTQLPSANVVLEQSDRPESFNGFAVEKIAKTLEVNNSEALVYALEQGMRPVIDKNASELNELYATMKNVLRAYVSDDMTEAEKALAIYQYIILSTTYDGELLEKVKSGANTDGNRSFCLEGVFLDQLAVCDGMSKAFMCLCRMEGIECVRVLGTKVDGGIAHAWNKVKVGGYWFVTDVTSGGMIVGSDEVMTLKYFLMTDSENEKMNVPDAGSHTDIKCDTAFDIHGALGFEAGSVDDAAALLKQFIAIAPSGKSTFELRLAYAVSSDSAAVSSILSKVGGGVSLSYVGLGGVICFVYTK